MAIDTTTVITELLPSLHAADRATLTHWTEANLEEWIDNALKRISRIAGMFAVRSTDNFASGTRTIQLGSQHLATLHVSVNNKPLRPAGSLELEARDTAYRTRGGIPTHWYEDLEGTLLALYPILASASSLAIVFNSWPPEIDTGELNTLVEAPEPLAAYLQQYVLSQAYAQEGPAEAPDIAEHCAGMAQMYEQVFAGYFGGAM